MNDCSFQDDHFRPSTKRRMRFAKIDSFYQRVFVFAKSFNEAMFLGISKRSAPDKGLIKQERVEVLFWLKEGRF
jgi:hypothetical protein